MNKLLFFTVFFVVFSVLALPNVYADNYKCKDCITTCAHESFKREDFENCFLEQCNSTMQPCSDITKVNITLDVAFNYVDKVKGCISSCLSESSRSEADLKRCHKKCNQRTSLF